MGELWPSPVTLPGRRPCGLEAALAPWPAGELALGRGSRAVPPGGAEVARARGVAAVAARGA
eukprot:2728127-Alexandrium_andersonii.AAC.1